MKRALGAVPNGAVRALFATSEIAPWVKTGGLGDVSAALPAALRQAGVDAQVLVPQIEPGEMLLQL